MAKDEKPKKGAEEAPPPKSRKKALLMAGLAIVLIGGGAGGYFFWVGQKAKPAVSKPAPQAAAPLQFFSLEPPFVANFEGIQGFRFLQVQVRIATRHLPTLELLTANEPILRNDLLMLFSGQNAEALSTAAGKEKLRSDALALVRQVVKTAGGDPKTVDSVLFTSFVMQ